MKTVFVYLCLALCATLVLGDYRSQCRRKTSCKASTSARVVIRGSGKCNVKARSHCSALALATRRCIDVDFQYRKLRCRGERFIEADAKCFAAAAVQAYTAASVEVDCRGRHVYGCARADAHARAVACSIARSIVRLVVFFKKQRHPACNLQVDVLIAAVAKVATNSGAGGCVAGNAFLSRKDFDYAKAFQVVFAKAFAECWTYCDRHGKDVEGTADGEGRIGFGGRFTRGDGAHAQLGDGSFPRHHG